MGVAATLPELSEWTVPFGASLHSGRALTRNLKVPSSRPSVLLELPSNIIPFRFKSNFFANFVCFLIFSGLDATVSDLYAD